MTCTACKSAEANPNTAEQTSGCMDCEARAIAQTSAIKQAASGQTTVHLDAAIRAVWPPEKRREGRNKVWAWYERIEEYKWQKVKEAVRAE